MWLLSAFAPIFLSAPLHAQEAEPQPPITVAVLNFVNRNPGDGSDWLEKGLADLLITDLSKSATLLVVERERMAWMLKELELGERGVVDPSTAGRVGRICKVDRVLFGSYVRQGDHLQIEAHIVEVESGELLRLELVEGKAGAVLGLEKRLALRILSRLHLPLSEGERRRILQMPTDSVDALTHYSFGLDAYDGGEYEEAIMEFRLALKKDPDYHKARMHLADKYFKIHEPEHALVEYRNVLRRDVEGRLTEDAYYQMGRVLERGMGNYREAIGCYEKILARHKEYEFERADVQQRITQGMKCRW
ncbi:MAG: tetratricopeptide repeat protein, partial [Planctomycetes bacterium]|nr:tetratricopeptide repeat protein [Planctomycetota bacterium]